MRPEEAIILALEAMTPFVDELNASDARYEKRGGNPHAVPDRAPHSDHKTLNLGQWRRLRTAHDALAAVPNQDQK